MDDIVAIRAAYKHADDRYFLTWGRIQENVDPEPLFALMRTFPMFGIKPDATMELISFQEASKREYFYECFWEMCQKGHQDGDLSEWRERVGALMQEGKNIWVLG